MTDHATAPGDPADEAADAMRALFDAVLSAVPAGQREQVSELLLDLTDLAADSLSGEGKDEAVRRALAASPDPFDCDETLDLVGTAMNSLARGIRSAVPPARRDQVSGLTLDLMHLAGGSQSPGDQAELISRALGTRARSRDYEVSLGTVTVSARTPQEAAAAARAQWDEQAADPHHDPDPNEVYLVRLAGTSRPWQSVCPRPASEEGT